MEAPVIFVCRNNGWAISTPTSDQFRSILFFLVTSCILTFLLWRVSWYLDKIFCFSLLAGDGVVVRGRAYGVRSIRVDGNDPLAIYGVVHAAREMSISENRPILIEVSKVLFVNLSGLWGGIMLYPDASRLDFGVDLFH